jgi:hypothetical protein
MMAPGQKPKNVHRLCKALNTSGITLDDSEAHL